MTFIQKKRECKKEGVPVILFFHEIITCMMVNLCSYYNMFSWRTKNNISNHLKANHFDMIANIQ